MELERKPGVVLHDSFFFHLVGEILVTVFSFYRENTNLVTTNLEDAASE